MKRNVGYYPALGIHHSLSYSPVFVVSGKQNGEFIEARVCLLDGGIRVLGDSPEGIRVSEGEGGPW